MKKIIIGIPLALAFIIFALIVDWHFPKVTSEYREPNKYDELYHHIAVANNRPDFCERISPLAYTVAPGIPGNRSDAVVALKQSECFYDLAIGFLNSAYCDKIKSINTWIYSGTEINPNKCRSEVSASLARGKAPGYENVRPTPNFVLGIEKEKEFLKEMGIDYAADPAYQERLSAYVANIEKFNHEYPAQKADSLDEFTEDLIFGDYWFDLERTETFMEKAKRLPQGN